MIFAHFWYCCLVCYISRLSFHNNVRWNERVMQMWLSLFIFLINHVEIMNARSYKIDFLKCTTTRLQLNIKIKRKTILILQHFANSATTCTLIINNCSHSKTDTCRLAADSRTTEFQNNIEKQIFVNQNMSLLSQKFKNEPKTSNTGLKANYSS